MITPIVGQRYLTPRGAGRCVDVTPMQVRMEIDGEDEPVWVTHAMISEAPPVEEPAELSVLEVLDEVIRLLHLIRESLAVTQQAAIDQSMRVDISPDNENNK